MKKIFFALVMTIVSFFAQAQLKGSGSIITKS